MAYYLFRIQDSYIPVEATNKRKAFKAIKNNIRLVATMSSRTKKGKYSPVILLEDVDLKAYNNFKHRYCKFLS